MVRRQVSRFEAMARLIESAPFTNAEKATLKYKAWTHFVSFRDFFGILLELGRVVCR